MLDRGKIIKVEGGMALVEFPRSSACAECGACALATSGQMTITADNPIKAQVGDQVEVEISAVYKYGLPLVNFWLPLIFLMAGFALGGAITQTIGVVLGIIFWLVGLLLVNKFKMKTSIFTGKIVKLISNSETGE